MMEDGNRGMVRGNFMSSAGNKNISKPPQVERARNRLDAAVARLEGAITASGGKMAVAMEQDLGDLRAENDRLGKLGDQVSARLDKTIGRLKTVLES